jgi:hypothetical protein
MRKPFTNFKGSQPATTHLRRSFLIAAACLITNLVSHADDTNLANEVQLLREQNTLLQQQVKQQGEQINSLSQQFQALQSARQIEGGNDKPLPESRFSLGKLHIGGEGGAGYAQTGSDGFAPNGEFRVDDARIFLESPIWGDVYFYGEVVLATQESPNMSAQLGEIYVEFENISKLWQKDNQLNGRLGQMYIPFGEEYITRNAIDNPLITHSVVDYWGVTPGVELYGNLGKFSYVAAAQNGANSDTGAGGDKSLAGRIGFDPNEQWHFSVSGMRTGNLNAGQLSAMWFANGFFQSVGANDTQFHVDAAEADATYRWKSGHASAFGGWAGYHDNGSGNDTRNIYYYSAEVLQNLPRKFYAVTRWSQATCNEGIPMVGYGRNYFSSLTTDLWRLSLGLGYRFSDQLVLKAEYSFEHGEELGGDARMHEDFFGTEAAFKF